MDRVVWESRHKFVYYDAENIGLLNEMSNQYSAKMNSEEPIVIYVKDEGLPIPDNNMMLNKDIIEIFHRRYYELLIFLSIIDEIVNHINNEELNEYLLRLFKIVSYCGNNEIKDIKELRIKLIESMNMYKEGYIKFISTGIYDIPYNDIPVQFVMLDDLLTVIKERIGLKKYFCMMLEVRDNISRYGCRAINDIIASRCNGYLSMNVLLSSNNQWKSYHANNGQFIEYVHDYTEVDLRSSKKRSRHN